MVLINFSYWELSCAVKWNSTPYINLYFRFTCMWYSFRSFTFLSYMIKWYFQHSHCWFVNTQIVFESIILIIFSKYISFSFICICQLRRTTSSSINIAYNYSIVIILYSRYLSQLLPLFCRNFLSLVDAISVFNTRLTSAVMSCEELNPRFLSVLF